MSATKPTLTRAEQFDRKVKIADMVRGGATLAEAANHFRVSLETARVAVVQHLGDLPPHARLRRAPTPASAT